MVHATRIFGAPGAQGDTIWYPSFKVEKILRDNNDGTFEVRYANFEGSSPVDRSELEAVEYEDGQSMLDVFLQRVVRSPAPERLIPLTDEEDSNDDDDDDEDGDDDDDDEADATMNASPAATDGPRRRSSRVALQSEREVFERERLLRVIVELEAGIAKLALIEVHTLTTLSLYIPC
jgi:hypothetical protein